MQRSPQEMKQKADDLYHTVSESFPSDAIRTVAPKDKRHKFSAGAATAVCGTLNVAVNKATKDLATNELSVTLRKYLPGHHEYKNPHLLYIIASTIFAKLYPYKTCRETSMALVNALVKAGFKKIDYVEVTEKNNPNSFRHYCVLVNRELKSDLNDIATYPKGVMVLDIWGSQNFIVDQLKGNSKNQKKEFTRSMSSAAGSKKPVDINLTSELRVEGLDAVSCQEVTRFLKNLLVWLDLEEGLDFLTTFVVPKAGYDKYDKWTVIPRLKVFAQAELKDYERLALEFQKAVTLVQPATFFMESKHESAEWKALGVDEIDRAGNSLPHGLDESIMRAGISVLARALKI